MREIKFRGYHEIAGWVIGSYRTNYDDHHAIADRKLQIEYFVKKESVGQYTGIEDEKSTELCQGDICYVEGLGNCEVDICKFYGAVFKKDGCEYPVIDSIAENDLFEVIGSIHENPELLESDNE